MVAAINNPHNYQMREYNRAEAAVFLKTKERYGGLSNMASGFPLVVNGIPILTSEALYQVCRFPHRPEVQRLIIEQKSPMSAKMKSKPFRDDTRPDWETSEIRVKVMRWCLQIKLAQNWESFSELLLTTGDRDIVENSKRDDFWGAKPVGDQVLVGANVLGRLLKQLRGELVDAIKRQELEALLTVAPLAIDDFLLYGKQIEEVQAPVRNPFEFSTQPKQYCSTVQERVESYELELVPFPDGLVDTGKSPPTPDSCFRGNDGQVKRVSGIRHIQVETVLGLFEMTEPTTEPSKQVVIDLNTATCTDLESLKPLNPKQAKSIVKYRELYGPFSSCKDIMKVPGLGQKTYEKLGELIRVETPQLL